jgi:uncharacterized protein YkwD
MRTKTAFFSLLFFTFCTFSFQKTPSETAVLEAVNVLRASGCNCPDGEFYPPVAALTWDNRLEKAAFGHANDMLKNNYFAHKSRNGTKFWQRINKTGYKSAFSAENIATGYRSAAAVVEGWKTSDGHCQNMMSADYKNMGAARAVEIWVLDLASEK